MKNGRSRIERVSCSKFWALLRHSGMGKAVNSILVDVRSGLISQNRERRERFVRFRVKRNA